MGVALARLWAAAALLGSAALMYAASWQRWSVACPWGSSDTAACTARQDHLYDFILPTDPWEPIGTSAQLAGASVVLGALALPGLAVALRHGRRIGPVAVLAMLVAVLAALDVGTATVRSGLDGDVVRPLTDDLALSLWLLAPLGVLVWAGVGARGWGIAGVGLLCAGSPLVASFSYAIGPYDAAPWWEAAMAVLTAAGALCVLLTAVRRPARRGDAVGVVATANRPGS